MVTLRKPIRRKGTTVWHILFCLTVVSFLFRAGIPMGYMPDFSGGSDGTFSITLCVAGGGTNTLQVGLSDQSQHSFPDDQADSQDCPFGLLASQALIPAQDAPMVTRTISHHPVVLAHSKQALPPLPALGPPLGSRAPPSNLG